MAAATAARGAHRPAGRGLLCSHAARRLRAPPAGSARLQGSPIPRRQRERPRARIGSGRTRSAAPGGGGDVVLSRRVLRDKTGSRSRGGATGAPGGGRQEAGREGARSPRGAIGSGPGTARTPLPRRGPAALRAGHRGRTGRPRRTPIGCPSPPPPARQRAPAAGWLPGTEPAAAGVGQLAGERGRWTSLTHHARLRLQRRRLPGGSSAAEASEPGAAGSPPALVPERVREEQGRHTHSHSRTQGSAARGGEGSRSPPPTFTRSGARGEGGLFSASPPSRHLKLRVTKAQDTR